MVTVDGQNTYSLGMKVLLDHPNPFFLAHGGFQIQIEQTKLALERVGVAVDWLRWWDSGQKADLIHYFGRPHPAYIQQCHEKGLKVVMAELLTGLGSRPTVARKIQKTLMAVACKTLPYDFISRLGWESYQKADAVIALTEWEKKLMIEMFSAPSHKIHVVPNGVEDVFLQDNSQGRWGDHLICTATITPRKRVLEMAQAAVLAQVKVRFFGQPYSPQDPYFQQFMATVRESGGRIEYGGGLTSRERLAEEYREAQGFVLLSGMESQSLSALEAAACGCPLLLSDLPWARSSFGDEASYAPIASREVTAGFFRRFMQGVANAPRVDKVPSWDEVATRLTQVYRREMTSR
jgi:glycosyltransferase involved in cell wall biosynthesis